MMMMMMMMTMMLTIIYGRLLFSNNSLNFHISNYLLFVFSHTLYYL